MKPRLTKYILSGMVPPLQKSAKNAYTTEMPTLWQAKNYVDYAYHSLNSGRWCPLATKVRSPRLTPIDIINRKSVATPWFSVKSLRVFPLNGDLILNGRPRAHHEDPMRALHSPMLQYGISVTANLELVTSHDDKIDSARTSNLVALSDLDLGTE